MDTSDSQPYDLVAVSPRGQRIAVAIRAAPQPPEGARQVAELRKRAYAEGYDEFRLVVVTPPKERTITIAGFPEKLEAYVLVHMATPPELGVLSEQARVEAVSGVEIDSIEVDAGKTRVAGRGSVSVLLEWDGREARDGQDSREYLSFSFEAELNADLDIVGLEFEADVSSFA